MYFDKGFSYLLIGGSTKKANKKRSSTAPVRGQAVASSRNTRKSSCSHMLGNVNSKARKLKYSGTSEKDVSSDDDYSLAFSNSTLQVSVKKRKSTSFPDNEIKFQLTRRMKSSVNSEPLPIAPSAFISGSVAPQSEHTSTADAADSTRAKQRSAQTSGNARVESDRKSTRLNSSHSDRSRMPSSA